MGGSCSNTNRFSDNGVQVLLEMAREAAAGGNVDEAQKLYESAIAKAPRIKEQNVIRKEMSSIEESLTKVVPSPRLKRKSAIIGGPFKRHILTGKVIKIGHGRHDNLAKIQSFSVEFKKMKKYLEAKDFTNANEAILTMLQMDCQVLKNVDDYFNGLIDYVQDIGNFQGISKVYKKGTQTLTEAYACRQNILI